MNPQEVLALLLLVARQQLRIGELEAEIGRLQELVAELVAAAPDAAGADEPR